MEWQEVKQPLNIDQAQALVGCQVKWVTPRRRISASEFAASRKAIAIYALPAKVNPVACPEIAEATYSQCYGMSSGRRGISDYDRLIVRVDRFHARTGDRLAPHYYAPRLSSIIAYQ